MKSYIGDCIMAPVQISDVSQALSSDDSGSDGLNSDDTEDTIGQLRANVEMSWQKVNNIASKCGVGTTSENFTLALEQKESVVMENKPKVKSSRKTGNDRQQYRPVSSLRDSLSDDSSDSDYNFVVQ